MPYISLWQITAKTGSITYYVARDTYPSEVYYEIKVTAEGNKKAVVFIPKPNSVDEEVVVYCSIVGDENEESEIEIEVDPGGTRTLISLYYMHLCIIYPFT